MEIKRIAVIGTGTMGRGIGHIGALAGYHMTLHDVSGEILEKSLAAVKRNLDKGVELGKVARQDADAALARITTTTDLAAAASGADLVIEAVTEDMGVKRELFAALDGICPAHALFASNTSALSITEMAAATGRPAQVMGMHFFNPPHLMKLVEVIRGLETAEETLETGVAVARRMGREPVRVNESPAFIASRINAVVGNEAFHMLHEGVAEARDIDRAVKLGLNYPMGPLELADLVGLDVRLSIMEYLRETLGERFRPSPLLVKYVKAGRLGRKTGKGVYEYD